MSYDNLIDVHVEVDTGSLEGRLSRIDERIDNVVTLTEEDVQTLIHDAQADSFDEDKVNDLIATYVSNEGYVTEYDMDRKLDDYVGSDDLDSRVEDVISNGEYMNASDVDSQIDDKIRDAIENGDFVNPAQMDEAISDALEARRGNADNDDAITDLNERLDSLTEQVKAQDSAIDGQREMIADLNQRMETLARDASAAVNVLSLLRQIVQSLFGSR